VEPVQIVSSSPPKVVVPQPLPVLKPPKGEIATPPIEGAEDTVAWKNVKADP
jgi:hypothetical protein